MLAITRSMLIHDTADNIYTALTQREDVAQWWGAVNPDADGTTVWYGRDREWDVPIVAMEPGKLLAFGFDAHHPYDQSRTEPTQITISITEVGNASIVTVVQSMFSDDAWSELIHDGWGYTLISLMLWVEHGITFAEFTDDKKFHTIKKGIALNCDTDTAWRALTDAEALSRWTESTVTSNPVVGGELEFDRGDALLAGGEWLSLSEPRNLIASSFDKRQVADASALGTFSLQQWLILPAVHGCAVTLISYGYDRTRYNNTALRRFEKRWDAVLGNLQQVAAQES